LREGRNITARLIKTLRAAVLASLTFSAPLVAQDAVPQADCKPIREMVVEGLRELPSIQGVSVAVYSPNQACAFGFGITDIETQESVTTDTSFYIASSTKSMLALALATMHERGEINLDQPIADLSPSAPFPRSIPTDEITLRHLLAMSSGIKNPAYVHRVAITGEHTQDQLWNLIGATERNRSRSIRFGKFRYTNWNYNLAARLIEEERAARWQDILREELFERLGMTRTTAYMSRATSEGWSLARPHATLDPNGTSRSYLEKVDATMQSAGGVIMSASDALKWLALFVDEGRLDGQQLIPARVIQATRRPLTEVDSQFNGFQRDHYGLGWYLGPYKETGMQLVHHFGGFSGARAHISYIPDRDLGVAIFVNDSMVGSRFIDTAARYIYDSFLELDGAQAAYRQEIQDTKLWATDIRSRVASLRAETANRPWALRRARSDYVGTYTHEDFGSFEISYVDGDLLVKNGQTHSIAQPGSMPDTIRVELIPLEGDEIAFGYQRSGDIQDLTFRGVRYDRND